MFNNNLLMGAASASGESLVEVGNSALYTTTSQELERTPGSAGNVDKFTFSAWVYFTQPTTSSSTPIFGAINTSANQHRILKTNTGQLQHDLYLSNSFVGRLITTQLLRDQAWYHIVAVYDSGNAIAGDRMMLYLNGERITDFATDTNPSQNLDGLICGAHLHQLGFHDGLSLSLNGYMAETVLLDGTVADPNSFGQYDSTGTFWTPKSSAEIKALTFGTTGFYLDNTTNAQTDASGEGNNFTNTGSVALSTHTPTQLWPIFNSLSIGASSGVTDGNTKVTYGDAGANYSIISFPGTGKFVAQCTADDVVSNGIGWVALNADGGVSTSNALVLNEARWIGLTGGNWIHSQYVDFVGGTNLGTVKTSASDGDILQLEWDNGTLTVQINGTRYTPSNWTAVDTSLNWAFLSRCAGNGTETWDFGQDGFTPHDTSYSYVNTTTLASAITRTKSNLEEYFSTTTYEGNGSGQRVGKFLPFTDTFTVGNSGLFNLISSTQNTSNARLTRTQAAGATTKKFCFSFWFKRGKLSGTNQYVYSDVPADGYYSGILINTSNQIEIFCFTSSSVMYQAATTRVIKDTSQWNHVVINIDTSQSTAADRQEMYLNGVDQPLTITNQISQDNTSFTIGDADIPIGIGSFISNSSPRLPFDGYLAEYVYINNVNLAASSFGQVDTSTGRWIPKSLSGLSFDSTGFYLNFATLGDDVSGNNNDFTNANVVQVADSPTVNIATLNPNDSAGGTISNGNKTLVTTGSSNKSTRGTIKLPNTGKYYWESNLDVASSASIGQIIGLEGADQSLTTGNTDWTDAVLMNKTNSGSVKINGADLFTTSGVAAINTKFQIAVDLDDNKMWFGVNNSWFNSAGGTDGNPSTGANPTISQDFSGYAPLFGNFNCQQTVRFDSADWTYTQPTGYVSLTQDSLPEGESYQTAWSWIKNRDATDNHMLFDRVRGIYNDIHSNVAAAQVTNVNTLQRFLNGGIQVGNDVQVNTASESYVAWNWYMETAGSGSSNTDGDINTEATLVDTNLGLSISKFDSGANGDHTIGHGLGVVPEFVIFKDLESANNVAVYSSHAGFSDVQDYLLLNSTAGVADNGASIWGAAFPTSSVLGFTTGQINNANKDCVALCFAPSQFTAIGSYVGNGNANGAFIPTVNSLGVPIQPAWFMAKSTGSGQDWRIVDNKRSPFNVNSLHLRANTTAADTSETNLDIDTGGIKIRTSSGGWNTSGTTYIYLAFGTPLIDVDGRIITGR